MRICHGAGLLFDRLPRRAPAAALQLGQSHMILGALDAVVGPCRGPGGAPRRRASAAILASVAVVSLGPAWPNERPRWSHSDPKQAKIRKRTALERTPCEPLWIAVQSKRMDEHPPVPTRAYGSSRRGRGSHGGTHPPVTRCERLAWGPASRCSTGPRRRQCALLVIAGRWPASVPSAVARCATICEPKVGTA